MVLEQLRLMFPDVIVPEELHTMLSRLDPKLAGSQLLALCESEAEALRIRMACARLGLTYGPGAPVQIREARELLCAAA